MVEDIEGFFWVIWIIYFFQSAQNSEGTFLSALQMEIFNGWLPFGFEEPIFMCPHELEGLDFPKGHEDFDLKLYYLSDDAENARQEWYFPQLIELRLGADGTLP